ncbi:receptor-type tyrosine-protein phosphatase epsilon-like [Haliotis asinina]|uniref:receptor-type tyrosine-protein phosphatase epsilon-like n=1 Tax=Haliotis asinina TaxID=109174 RepID=UPI003531FBEE
MGSSPNWWRVDLSGTVSIRDVTIYFRTDWKPRRNGIQVYVTNSTDTPSGDNCYNVTGRSDGNDIDDVTRAPCSGRGRYILLYTTVNNEVDMRITLPRLDFCEVEVDVCGPGTFGADCDNYCHCDSDVCNYVSGVCPGGTCMSGWMGNSCNITCPTGQYGRDCTQSCADRQCKDNTSSCSHDTGECSGGCLAGYTTPDCTQECSNSYGEDCGGNCTDRHCSDASSSECDHVTGWCDGGCSPVWKGVSCITGCVPDVEYGAGCIGNCSARMCEGGNVSCPQDSGRCENGCEPGWMGEDCVHRTVSSHQTNGASTGGIVGGVVAVAVAVVVLVVVAVVFYRRKHKEKNINKGNTIYEDITAMGPEGNQMQVSQGEDREDEEDQEVELEKEADRGSYYNMKSPVVVTEVDVDKLEDGITELQAREGGFEQEYMRLISGFTHTYEDSQREENSGKNRFRQYYPYDYNRVVLERRPVDPSSDYINASYINGYTKDQAYIAAQAPNRKTVGDFWRMIYEKNLTRIVMLTNLTEAGKVKCVPYWSDTSDLNVDVFTISVTNISPRAQWVIRELKATLKETGESRLFQHFHYTKWPDHGTPEETALMEFVWRIRKTPNPDNTPLMVHCSAGIGRTGTYIAVDYLLDRALADQRVDVFGFVNLMRQQRRNMIQTKEQYACVYTTLHEALMMGDTTLTSTEFRQERRAKRVFKMGTTTVSQMMQRVKVSIKERKSAGRIEGRVWVNGKTDVLAVMMPSHLSMNGYLLTEAPSVTTASLFWKLTEEQESSTVIVLPDSHQNLAGYIPSPGHSQDLSTVIVSCSTETSLNSDIVLRKIDRKMEGNNSSQLVHVYLLKTFRKDDHSSLFYLLDQVDLNIGDNSSHPLTVIFSESERRSATLFCILSNVVQGMKYDNVVEIYNNIRQLGHLCDNDLSQADVSLCYDLASSYLETQNIYANM